MGVLSRQQIGALLKGPTPLVSGHVDLELQLQPNGFDLTLQSVARFQDGGRLGGGQEDRRLSSTQEVAFDETGFIHLPPGTYLITFNEAVRLPDSIMALAKPRSSLLRSGVAIHNAVWDAGYQGRSQALLVVYNAHGFSVSRNARLLQMVFMALETPTDAPYAGLFQGERL